MLTGADENLLKAFLFYDLGCETLWKINIFYKWHSRWLYYRIAGILGGKWLSGTYYSVAYHSFSLHLSHSLCLLSTSIILTPTLTLSLLPTTRYTQSTIQSSCTQTHNLLHTHFLLLSFSFFLSSFIFFFFFLFSSSAAATAATTKCNNKRSEKTSAIFFSCVHFPA